MIFFNVVFLTVDQVVSNQKSEVNNQ